MVYVRRKQRQCVNILILMMVCSFLALWSLKYKTKVIKKYFDKPNDDILCYNIQGEDVLPSAESEHFFPNPNSIFFHETSCRGNLNQRQACAIESAARAHPERQINVLFSSPLTVDTYESVIFKELRNFDNVTFARVHINEYSKGTPMENMVLSGVLNSSLWPVTHASDMLRFMTLYKWGGIYIDLDMIVVQTLDSLAENFAARESDEFVGSSILAFSQNPVGRILSEMTVRDVGENFRGDEWGHNGPFAITRALQNWCNTFNVTEMSVDNCKGFQVYDKTLFYPIDWHHRDIFFEQRDILTEKVYTYHVWNQFTKETKAQEGSLLTKLAEKYCPSIYRLYGDKFGL